MVGLVAGGGEEGVGRVEGVGEVSSNTGWRTTRLIVGDAASCAERLRHMSARYPLLHMSAEDLISPNSVELLTWLQSVPSCLMLDHLIVTP